MVSNFRYGNRSPATDVLIRRRVHSSRMTRAAQEDSFQALNLQNDLEPLAEITRVPYHKRAVSLESRLTGRPPRD